MNSSLEKKNYYIILFDFYGDLFTNKQRDVFNFYYDEDYSLSEIAESLNISRNAVWDSLNKILKSLDYYESILHLYEKDTKLKNNLDLLKKHTDIEGKQLIENMLREDN